MTAPPDLWKVMGYTLLRVGSGVSLVSHAIPGLLHLPGFVERVNGMFAQVGVAEWMVQPVAWLIPPVEVALGTLTVLGVWTRFVLAASAVWMIVLLAGSNILQRNDLVVTGLLYLIIYFLLLHFSELNVFALDRAGRSSPPL